MIKGAEDRKKIIVLYISKSGGEGLVKYLASQFSQPLGEQPDVSGGLENFKMFQENA